ncbi:CatB-related O-acetyltransferase [Clostridium felsineum]|uniref:CatB-related O-acetyltransferase n=1 Tax=Clostridium felsineum TaxID=36839 RepID=UPI00254BDB4F|nr:CatB-related O-acetyltransferase [Clostridium felsineum]
MKIIIDRIIYHVKLVFFKIKWRKKNKNNFTSVKNIFDLNKVKVGKMSYGILQVHQWDDAKEKLIIGEYVSIALGTEFILGGNHRMDTISTYPFKTKILGESDEAYTKGTIIIEDGVWIGMNSIILSGVTIGKGAVVGAGSVVSKNIPPYAVAVGNPAKIIKYRIPKKLIQQALEFDYSKIDNNFIKKNLNLLYSELNEDVLKRLNSN